MNIKINKRFFVENLLIPASKITDNVSLDFQESNVVKTLVTSADNSTVLMSSIPCEVEHPFKCIVPDSKTFLRLFTGINDEVIELTIDSNVIKFNSNGMSFKYHLLDDSYVTTKKSLSEEKLNQIQFDTTFVMPKAKFTDILKYNSIIPDAEKLYFSTNTSGGVVAKIGDDLKSNTNEITIEFAERFDGAPLDESVPLNIQNMLLLNFNDDNINISINHSLKIFKFVTPLTKYIISGLVK